MPANFLQMLFFLYETFFAVVTVDCVIPPCLRNFPISRKNMLSVFAECKIADYTPKEGSCFFQNDGNVLPDYTVSRP